MNIGWDEKLKRELTEEICAVDFPKETEERILNHVHGQIKKRRIAMKISRKHTGIVLAAALVVIGSITAIGAGKIAFTSSGHSVSDEIQNIDELTAKAESELGEAVRIPESLGGEITFSSGIVNNVDAWDDEHNKVGSFPEAHVNYKDGQGKSLFALTITKPLEGADGKKAADVTETYQELELYGRVDQYLFLPPEQEPTEEQKQLEAEGKLFISYGSSEVENETFTHVSWSEGELCYLLSSFEEIDLSEMMDWAKEVIDSGKSM